MDLKNISAVYFIGIGGIGMSALARYFLANNKKVAGYDKISTTLTQLLEKEGAEIHYNDNVSAIPNYCLDKEHCLVVYTPAVPATHSELHFFKKEQYQVVKRAEVLGFITMASKGLCIAGTHGKTTTSAMLAHLLYQTPEQCNAFLGGILKNNQSNLLLSSTSPYTVIEADEYDRSFHKLKPYISVITSADPDHLDIYHSATSYYDSFNHYTSLIQPGGALLIREELKLTPKLQPGVKQYTYSRESGDFHADNIKIGDGEIVFDFIAPNLIIPKVKLGVPVSINIENSIAAMAIAHLIGTAPEVIAKGIATFQGVDRRFDFKVKNDKVVYLNDYAHHPSEIKQCILSLKEIYPTKKISIIFQPHLFSRTKDFYNDFAESLSFADEVILTDIYPAREEPIPGVTSRLIFDAIAPKVEKSYITLDNLLTFVAENQFEVLATLGAGDIINSVEPITKIVANR